jgi:hypothetical protein
MINMEIKLQTHSNKIMALEVGQMLSYVNVYPCYRTESDYMKYEYLKDIRYHNSVLIFTQ